jgi:hypothetical protein
MDSVKFILDQNYGYYSYREASNVEMNVLGMFLNDIGCPKNGRSIFLDWAIADKNDPSSGFTHTCGTNTILLDEDDNGKDIYLIEHIGNDPDDPHYIPPRIRMTRQQFVQLLDDWQEKVCKKKPKEVIVRHENDQFVIEISN